MGSFYCTNKNVKYFLCAIDVFNRKPNKLWVDQGREIYNELMQEQLDNNEILRYLTHNEHNSVIGERFIKALKAKIYKKMTANDSKSYLSYLNKLVDQYNNTFNHSFNKEPINADYSTLTQEIETNPKANKFKVNNRARITK